MKKFLIIILLLNILLLFAENNFRDTKWGMSKEEVKIVEKSELFYEDKDLLTYKTEISNIPVMIQYMFIDKKLYQTIYHTYKIYTSGYRYIIIYEQFVDILKKKYGPCVDNTVIDRDYRNDTDLAIFIGKAIYYSTWDLGDIIIDCSSFGQDYQATTAIYYSNKELLKIAEDKNSKKTMEEF